MFFSSTSASFFLAFFLSGHRPKNIKNFFSTVSLALRAKLARYTREMVVKPRHERVNQVDARYMSLGNDQAHHNLQPPNHLPRSISNSNFGGNRVGVRMSCEKRQPAGSVRGAMAPGPSNSVHT